MSDVARPQEKRLRLDPSEYERSARQYAERVYRTLVALEPLYDVHEAIEWLNSSQSGLRSDRPAHLLATHGGTVMVEQAISIVLDGAFS